MPKKDDLKTREYYIEECCRLRNKLKNCENRKFENEVYKLRKQLKELREGKKEDVKNNEKTVKYRDLKHKLEEEQSKNDRLLALVKDLKTQLLNIDLKYQNIISEKEKIYKNDKRKIKLLTTSINDFEDFLKQRLSRIFNMEYRDIILFKDNNKISTKTILFDLINIFLSLKLFEINLADYVIDRQDPDTQTDYDTILLFKQCHEFSIALLDKLKFENEIDFQKYDKIIKAFIQNFL